jgi:Uma2 family endonuclease
LLKTALRDGGRGDLHPVTGVGVRISTGMRTALIPDVAVLNVKPFDTSFQPENLVLVIEVWSPGNSRTERETKAGAYASAGIPFFWVVNADRLGGLTVTTYRLTDGGYVEEISAGPGTTITVTAAPVPITLDPADLLP